VFMSATRSSSDRELFNLFTKATLNLHLGLKPIRTGR
jgi:hypothetical protein